MWERRSSGRGKSTLISAASARKWRTISSARPFNRIEDRTLSRTLFWIHRMFLRIAALLLSLSVLIQAHGPDLTAVDESETPPPTVCPAGGPTGPGAAR